MKKEPLVSAKDFCISHRIEYSFISRLNESGLIELTTIDRKAFIQSSQLADLEKIARLHYDLEINLEGIEAISHLLQRIDSLQQEMNKVRNRLRFYEADEI